MDTLQIILVIATGVALVFVVRWRRRGHAQFVQEYAQREICEHLRPALDLLRSRGHAVVRAGQRAADFPLEIHLEPGFDPQAIYDELKLAEPVRVSERGVLLCYEDECELRPPAT